MLRILFSILAIVAAAITFTIEITDTEWWKYIPMAGLVIISLFLWIFGSSTKSGNKGKSSDSDTKKTSREETLEGYGITDVRPVSPSESEKQTGESSPDEEIQSTPTNLPESIQLSLPTDSSQFDSGSIHNPAKCVDPLDKHILVPILQGFRAALNAHAVGIIRSSSDNYEYEIRGTVGLDWTRSRGESFVLKHDLLRGSETTAIHSVGSGGLQSNHLTYSRRPASITAFGITAIGETGNFLIVDTIDKNGLSHPRAEELLETFGQTFNLMLYKEDPRRPRHEIISEEMAKARFEKNELALALVAPKKAETLSETYKDSLEKIGQLLSECLEHARPESRVIRLNEQVYGVLTDGNQSSLGKWYRAVQQEISKRDELRLLSGGVFIGVAIMTEKHQNPHTLREDARSALAEAFNSNKEIVQI